MAPVVGRLGTVGSWVLVVGLLGAAAVRPWGCDPRSATPGTNEALAAVLADVGPKVVVPALERARDSVDALAADVAAWGAAVEGGGDAAATRTAAQDSWRAAMAAWQEVEVLQIGPAASSLVAVAGEGIRDEVYSWPTVNRCRVDQITVSGEWEEEDFFETQLVTAYGLDALEVLLFSPDDENGCPPQVDINADGTWDALGVDEVLARRAAYAHVVATGIAIEVRALADAWDPAVGDFGALLAAAGTGTSPYESTDEALTAVFDALFYIETMTKDRKLGRPLGLGDCAGTACVDEVESPLAGESHTWIGVNLVAFRALFTGADGQGMDDLLVAFGRGDVADAMTAALDAADAAADALTVPIEVAATTDPAPALAVHAAIAGVTDLLKGDVATILVLRIPDEAAGDND